MDSTLLKWKGTKMNIKISKDIKKYILLIEELKELVYENYLWEKYYPDMAEITESIYDSIVCILNNNVYESSKELNISYQYTLEELETLVKQGRKIKRRNLKDV